MCVGGGGGGGGAAGSTHLHLEPATLHVRAHNSNFLHATPCLAFQNLPLYLTGTTILPVRGRQSTCYTTVCYSLSACHFIYKSVTACLPICLSVWCLSFNPSACYSLLLCLPVIQPLCLLQSVTLSACHFIYQSVTACLSTHLLVPVIQPLACQSILLKLHTKNQTSNLQNGRNDALH